MPQLDVEKFVAELGKLKPKSVHEIRNMALLDLKSQRSGAIESLAELNAAPASTQGLSAAVRMIEDELVLLNAEIRRKEDGLADEAERAKRMMSKDVEYETGALLAPSQSVRGYLEDNGLIRAHDFKGLRLGAVVRSMITGPKTELERRALAEGSDATGGVSVPDITSAGFVDALRPAMVTIRAGAQTVPLISDKTTIAKTTGDAAAGWRAENAAVDVDDPTFEGVVLTPRSLAVIVKCSRELLEDSVNIEQALEASFRGAMAVELDRVALLGSGTPPEPRGIKNVVGINSYPSGPFTNYDPLIAGMAMNWMDNEPITTAIVMSPANYAELAMLKEATTNAYLAKPPVLADIPLMQTMSMDDDTAIIGNFARLIIGIRTSLRIEILRELYAENMQYAFLVHLRADIAVEHPESFCKVTNLTVS